MASGCFGSKRFLWYSIHFKWEFPRVLMSVLIGSKHWTGTSSMNESASSNSDSSTRYDPPGNEMIGAKWKIIDSIHWIRSFVQITKWKNRRGRRLRWSRRRRHSTNRRPRLRLHPVNNWLPMTNSIPWDSIKLGPDYEMEESSRTSSSMEPTPTPFNESASAPTAPSGK